MEYDGKRALELLRLGSGIPDAKFREDQEAAIRHVVEGRGKLLVVQKTGWGKSFVYFIAAKLLREGGAGPSLLISPLLSLMRNQIAAAERMGARAATINSANTDEWASVQMSLERGEVDILLISPERLGNDEFRQDYLPRISAGTALLVIDEVHCISDWGHDFRPDYRRIERIAQNLPPSVQVLGTTATANERVLDDLEQLLGPNIQTMRGDLSRSSLFLQTIKMPTIAERLAWLAERLPEISGSGIIYALTIRDVERIAAWLKSQGLDARAYHGRTPDRETLEQDLLENRVKVLVATTALGMGYDKPDLAFVIHFQTPGSVVAYYQQVGRAGRGVDTAYGVLLSGSEDTDITDFFINSSFPTREEVNDILNALKDEPDGLSIPGLLPHVNIRQGRLEQAIKLLALESPAPIAKQGSKWQLTPTLLSNGFWERVERLTDLRHQEQRQMQEYLELESGHMGFLIRALGGEPGETARPPNLSPLPAGVSQKTAQEAVQFLQRSSIPIGPRKQSPERRPIPKGDWPEVGRALCYWGDPGWGELVREGKYEDNHFADDLVTASAELIGNWQQQPAPVWVTCIPSLRNSSLVKSLAERLALTLGLPFREVLDKTADRPPQKHMANSAQQARNVEGSLGIVQGEQVLPGPVLLVDDMVDSRWTFTVATKVLRDNGCGNVWPFALANTSTAGE